MTNVIKLSEARNAQMKPAEVLTVMRGPSGSLAGLGYPGVLSAAGKHDLAHDLLSLAMWLLSEAEQTDPAAFMVLVTKESNMRCSINRNLLDGRDSVHNWVSRRLDQAKESLKEIQS